MKLHWHGAERTLLRYEREASAGLVHEVLADTVKGF